MHVPRRGPEGGQLQLPPGFRFYPSDEELVVHYLCRKAASQPFAVPIIAEVDLYKFDPWSLPEKALFGEKEWYFFSPRDRKYPNGSRPNRAAGSGYWKATGTDKPISIHGGQQKVGVKKALVFYIGKAPKGEKTNWIMHEYRLADSASRAARRKGSLRLDDWVLCRIYEKIPSALRQQGMASMSTTTPTTTSNSNTTRMESASDHEEEEEGGGEAATRTTTMTTGAAPTGFDDVLASLPEVDDKKLVRLLNGTSVYSNQQYPVDPSSFNGGGNGGRGYNMFNANQSDQLIHGQAQSQQMNELDHVMMQRQAQAQSSESDRMAQIRQGQLGQISGMMQRQQQQYGHDHPYHHQQHYRKGHGSSSASMAMMNSTPVHGDQPHHVALSTPSISSRPQPHIDVSVNNRDNQLDFFNFDYGLSSPVSLNFPALV